MLKSNRALRHGGNIARSLYLLLSPFRSAARNRICNATGPQQNRDKSLNRVAQVVSVDDSGFGTIKECKSLS